MSNILGGGASLKKEVLFPLLLSASAFVLLGCESREDVLEEWSADYTDQCTSLGKENKLGLSGEVAIKRVSQIQRYWSKTQEGEEWSAHLERQNAVFCFGAKVSEYSDISIDGKKGIYFINKDISNENVAREILVGEVSKQYNKAVDWSEKYTPEDSLLWSRAISAHKTNIKLSQTFDMADRYFQHPLWLDAENDEAIGKYAQSFRETMEMGYSRDAAHAYILEAFLKDANGNADHDRTFLKWYDKFLHAREELTATFCLGFDGSLEPCLTTEIVVPEKDTAASKLTAETLTALSGAYTSVSYLKQEWALSILENPDFRTVTDDVYSMVATSKKNAGACCGENLGKGSQGMLGLSFSGKLGIAF